MTNLDKVFNLINTKKELTDKKVMIEEIVNLLGVSKANAAVYYSKATKMGRPVVRVKKEVKTKEQMDQEYARTNAHIASIIQRANNYVFTF